MPPEIDLRSDTVTKPCADMLQAMLAAEVGDDVICRDPTVEMLQERLAEALGKEAALFVPSGTMANQIALRLHCQPGDEFLCEAECHIHLYEQGGFAQLSGLAPRLVLGKRGVLERKDIQDQVSPEDDHALRTKLVTLENTHNRGGGTVQPFEVVRDICAWARGAGLKTHMDGARLFHAVIASGIDASLWAAPFDTISVCFSKGLGAPIGSALVGSADAMRQARRIRKLFGGGMRQAGYLAAAALFALENNVERLAEDHAKALQLAEAASECKGLYIEDAPQTNIVLIGIHPEAGTPKDLVSALACHGVGAFPFGREFVRLVTHKDVSSAQIEGACLALKQAASELSDSRD